MTQEQAKKLAESIWGLAWELFIYTEDKNMSDFDYWVGISEDWDLNFWVDEQENEGQILRCDLHRVIDGNTKIETKLELF